MTEIHALSGAYAVDALDEDERSLFERHLAGCAECREEVAGLREAAAALSEVTASAPPAALRDSVLAGIAVVRPLPPETSARHAAVRERPRTRRWVPVLVAAVVLAVAGVGVTVWQPWGDDAETVVAQSTATEQVLSAADAESWRVELAGGAAATVTRSVGQGRAVIQTEAMPEAPDGQVYELWLQRPDGSLEPAGLMPSGPENTVLLAGDARAATGAGVTVEPRGGSDEPTTEPVVFVDFTDPA
jgi:anti-sigma-K factor RskA